MKSKNLILASLCSLILSCNSNNYETMLKKIKEENHRGKGIKGYKNNYYYWFDYVTKEDSIALIFNYENEKLNSKRVYDRKTKEFKKNEFIHYYD